MIPSPQKFIRTSDGDYQITEKNAEIEKISGTRLAGLLGKSKWDTPFSTSAKMLRLFEEDISQKKEIIAGHIIEPKILKYVGAIPGEEIFKERKGNHADWPSDFDDDTFCGHIDGMMPDGTVVEVKTTKNPEDWLKGVPEYYWIQASLYAHFLKSEKIIFLVGFTDADILDNPETFIADDKSVARYEVPIIPGFDEMMERAKKLYQFTIEKGMTCPADFGNAIDERVMNVLNAQIWTEDEAKNHVDALRAAQAELDELKEYEKKVTNVKEMLSMYMAVHDTDVIHGSSYTAKRSTVARQTVDTGALKRDGIYDIYMKETTYETIRMTKRR